MASMGEWAGPQNDIAKRLLELNDERGRYFRKDPNAFRSASNTVANAAEGDYKDRQLFELVQNAVDAMGPEAATQKSGRVAVVLTPTALYCANEGRPFTFKGFEALCWPYVTGKGGEPTIGQFGLGFRSVAYISNSPEVVSRSCSIRYSSEELLEAWFGDDIALRSEFEGQIINLLSYAIPFDPRDRFEADTVMQRLMTWASTIVRLPLDRDPQKSYADLKGFMEDFPPEFLLFCRNLETLEFEIHDPEELTAKTWCFARSGKIESRPLVGNGNLRCDRMAIPVSNRNRESTEWLVFSDVDIPLEDLLSRDDAGLSRARRKKGDGTLIPVTLSWALNTSAALNQRGRFWFFFPTQDEVSLTGIVNAPWDTNAGRTNVLSPESNGFNRLLMQRLEELVVAAIPEIARNTSPDIGRFLDFLPSRGDEESSVAARYFVPKFWRLAGQRQVLPNLDEEFCFPATLRRWPAEIVSGVMASNSYVIDVANVWSGLSTDRQFPNVATFKSLRRNRCLNDLFEGSLQGGEA